MASSTGSAGTKVGKGTLGAVCRDSSTSLSTVTAASASLCAETLKGIRSRPITKKTVNTTMKMATPHRVPENRFSAMPHP